MTYLKRKTHPNSIFTIPDNVEDWDTTEDCFNPWPKTGSEDWHQCGKFVLFRPDCDPELVDLIKKADETADGHRPTQSWYGNSWNTYLCVAEGSAKDKTILNQEVWILDHALYMLNAMSPHAKISFMDPATNISYSAFAGGTMDPPGAYGHHRRIPPAKLFFDSYKFVHEGRVRNLDNKLLQMRSKFRAAKSKKTRINTKAAADNLGLTLKEYKGVLLEEKKMGKCIKRTGLWVENGHALVTAKEELEWLIDVLSTGKPFNKQQFNSARSTLNEAAKRLSSIQNLGDV